MMHPLPLVVSHRNNCIDKMKAEHKQKDELKAEKELWCLVKKLADYVIVAVNVTIVTKEGQNDPKDGQKLETNEESGMKSESKGGNS